MRTKARILSALAPFALIFSLSASVFSSSPLSHMIVEEGMLSSVPKNYHSTYQAIPSYVNGSGVYESITSLPVKGIEGQTVTRAYLNNPAYPLYAQ